MTSHGSADKKNDEVDLTVPGDLAILAFIELLQRDKGLLDPNIEEKDKLQSYFAEQRQIKVCKTKKEKLDNLAGQIKTCNPIADKIWNTSQQGNLLYHI